MNSENKKYFWSGVIFTCLGVVFLAPLTYHDFSNGSAVGPFFGICIGITFTYMGIMRIKKSRQPDNYQASVSLVEASILNQPTAFEFVAKKIEVSEKIKVEKSSIPLFIKCVALSPLLPLSIWILAEIGCRFMGYRNSTCIGYSLQESVAYLGVLGWFVSLPIAVLLSLIYSSSKL